MNQIIVHNRETATFCSQSPLRIFLRESYKHDEENLRLETQVRTPPKTAPAATTANASSRQLLLGVSEKVALNLTSQPAVPTQKSAERKVLLNQQLREKDKDKRRSPNHNESLRIFDSYFDMTDSDADNENTADFLSKHNRRLYQKNRALHKSLPHSRKGSAPSSRKGSSSFSGFHNVLSQESSDSLWKDNERKSPLKEVSDDLPIRTLYHHPMEKSQESMMNNSADMNDTTNDNHLLENIQQNREYLLELRSKLKNPGLTMSKTTRRGSWMGAPQNAKDETYVNRRVRFPDGTPVIVMVYRFE